MKRDNVMLDMRGVRVAKDAAFRVEDERGKVLGSVLDPPRLETDASGAPVFRNVECKWPGLPIPSSQRPSHR